MNVFLKKYENTFVRHLLSKVLSKGNIDAVVACTSWIKSHNYTNWMMAAFFRENIQNFIDNLTDNDNDDLINEFNQKADRAVQILETKEDTIEESVIKFLELRGTLHELFDSFKGRYESFMDHGYKNDDQFALFTNVLNDFLVYVSLFISIRTGNWNMRVAGLKMAAIRFVRSGAVLYKWLILRHLADISSYPACIVNRMQVGGWVSVLKDGKGVALARDEYHERTASKDIKLMFPKQLNQQNMEVLTYRNSSY